MNRLEVKECSIVNKPRVGEQKMIHNIRVKEQIVKWQERIMSERQTVPLMEHPDKTNKHEIAHKLQQGENRKEQKMRNQSRDDSMEDKHDINGDEQEVGGEQ